MLDCELHVVTGAVIAYRLFDVAYAVNLAEAERLWAQRARSTSTRSRLSTTPPKAIAFGVPPVELTLDPVALHLGAASASAHVTMRLYDFGVVTFALRLAADGLPWPAFTEFMNTVDRSVGPGAATDVWISLLAQFRATFVGALIRPTESTVEEDYLVGAVTAFDEILTAEALRERVDLVPLLSGEQRPLSAAARQDLLGQHFSYYTDDLAVLTWDRAFIYEPRRDSDVADILEVANAQLLEMRYYDELLDAELPRMYTLVEGAQRTAFLLASRRFANLARRLSALVAEVTELTEKVDNALQVTEDVYLARVYAAALELFRVPTVGVAVDRKLAIVRDTYAALYQEASAARAALMEGTIVLLIVLEIILALIHR
jgi:hypothetical protein